MSNETKQTAVDYLLKYCERENWSIPFEVEHTAKEMEKEQRGYTKADVIKAGEMGEINHHDTKHIVSCLDEAKQFNETHGGNK